MPLESMLVISTAHLDPQTAEYLEKGIHFGIEELFEREFGYLIFPNRIEHAKNDGNPVPKCLVDILEIAKLDNVTLIMLDAGADEDGRIPTWGW